MPVKSQLGVGRTVDETTTVACPACHNDNPAGMRFCGFCAAPLPLTCPSCGQQNAPGMRFCGYCATPLAGGAQAPSAPAASPAPARQEISPPSSARPVPSQEERRLVTALFCDLVGFTPLSEQLDPEEVRDIQATYFDAMNRQIERYGGMVEKYAGDAVLALFGTPIAHEDDAERAVLCALGMQIAIEPIAAQARSRWKLEPAIRVGVNTGEVVSGTWSASGRQEVAVTGDAVNTAARIQAAAEPGEILSGAETMRLTRRRVRFGERRDVTLKGKAGTVPVWPALGIREEFGERWERYETPLVGRDREMVQLFDAWVRAQSGEGQLVTVVGDAGVGKSRLIAEFLGKIASSATVRVVRARSLSYGQAISLWLLADLLRSLFGIKEQDTLDDVVSTLDAGIPNLLGDTDRASQAEALDVLGEVLGLPPRESPVERAGPQIRRQALLRSLRAVLGAVTERAPVVMVLEDLHWVDAASQEVLEDVLADVLGLRVLVIAAHRPGWTAPWSGWGWPERLTLRPLREDEATALAGAVLGGMPLAPELEQYVAERAGGNPFFVEEMLLALQEAKGIEERNGHLVLAPGAAEKLPSTLTEVLLARLDRLEGASRNIAQVASVIGRTFDVKLLAEVIEQEQIELEAPLAQLQRAEIAFPRRNPELEYVFKHVSMRDVAYNTLVHRRKQELHLRVARAIASLYPSDEYAEMIAYHYSRTDAPEAAEWLERAGDRASAIYAKDAAIGHYTDARRRWEAAGAGEKTLARLDEKLGNVLMIGGRYVEALQHLERAANVYRENRDLDAAGRTVASIGMTHRLQGTPEEGIAQVRPLIDLLSWSGPSESLASLHLALAQLAFLTGRYREMRDAAEKAGEIALAIGNDRQRGEAQERSATALTMLGQPEESRRMLEESLPLIEAGGDQVVLWRALNNAGEAAKVAGDLRMAREYTQRGVEVAARIGNLDQLAFIQSNLGMLLTVEGEWERAREQLERALSIGKVPSRSAGLSAPLCGLGQLALVEGRWTDAQQYLNQALTLVGQTGDRQLEEIAKSLLAELQIQSGRPEAAVGLIEPLLDTEDATLSLILATLAWALLETGDVARAAELAEQSVQRTRGHEPLYLGDALRVLALVQIRQGRFDEAVETLEEGLALTRSLPYPYVEARLLEGMALLHQARGETAETRAALDEALATFRQLGARKDVERVEKTLGVLATS